MLVVEVLAAAEGDEELRFVAVRAAVGHAENAPALVAVQLVELILKGLAAGKGRLAATPRAGRVYNKGLKNGLMKLYKILKNSPPTSALDHEVFDESVELGAVVVAPLAEGHKVVARLGHRLAVQL